MMLGSYMMKICGVLLLALCISSNVYGKAISSPTIVSRQKWGARPPTSTQALAISPVPYVVVHHGGMKHYCFDEDACTSIVQSYQNLHMDTNGWADIGYSFVLGEDGLAYEGRGWDSMGAHAPPYNNQSIGISIIGDFSDRLPNDAALNTLEALINYGVSIGKISADYLAIGHRQAKPTLCPGDQLYAHVQKLSHWTSSPSPESANSHASRPQLNIFT